MNKIRKFLRSVFKGHLTVYGNNAMHYGVNIHTQKWGFICFRLPLRSCGKWWPLYFYVSPNATPWAATFMLGNEDHGRFSDHNGLNDPQRAKKRRDSFGHNFNTDLKYLELCNINGVTPESHGL